MYNKITLIIVCILVGFNLFAQPSLEQCSGTAMLYNVPSDVESKFFPDTLSPIFINHLGRHGARYPTSNKDFDYIINILSKAKSDGALTNTGNNILNELIYIRGKIGNSWGLLTKRGEQEQRGIAKRDKERFSTLLSNNSKIEAISTYVTRCIESMDAFTNELKLISPNLIIKKNSGKQYDNILRFYDVNKEYLEYKEGGDWKDIYDDYVLEKIVPAMFINKLFNNGYTLQGRQKKEIYMAYIKITQIMPCLEIENNLDLLLNYEDNFTYWQTQNLRQYLVKSASKVGKDLPIKIAKPLMEQFINVADSVISGEKDCSAYFRFAHAETIIPFAALARIKGAYEPNSSINLLYKNWQDYKVSPMAANIQWVFYKGKSGEIYLQVMLNENIVEIDGLNYIGNKIYKWREFKDKMQLN